jgi:type I restriction enzyme S subunit
MRGGYTPSTKNPEFWTKEGGFQWYTMDDIRKNGRKLTKSIRQITAEAIKSKGLFPAGTIVFATSATIGEHAMLMCPALTNQRFTALIPKLDNVFMPFYYHYGFIIDEWCLQHIKRGGFCSVDMEGFAKLSIPLPPLAEQRAIAEKLDTIDAFIANLKEERALRQQQYEYYRKYLINLLK